MYNPYEILGLTSSATLSEVDRAYNDLRRKYQADRYEIGIKGDQAAEKLQQIELAYYDIKIDKSSAQHKNNEQAGSNSSFNDSEFGRIEELIKSGDINAAQEALDNVSVKDAEWHYVQSIIFYSKNWYLESKKQLEMAVSIEPNNVKYSNSLKKLNQIIASGTISPDQMRTTSRPINDGQYVNNNGSCTGSCCGDMCLANICCRLGGCMPCNL